MAEAGGGLGASRPETGVRASIIRLKLGRIVFRVLYCISNCVSSYRQLAISIPADHESKHQRISFFHDDLFRRLHTSHSHFQPTMEQPYRR